MTNSEARKRAQEAADAAENSISRPASPQPANSPSDALAGAQGVEAIRARVEAATPGPWFGSGGGRHVFGATPGDEVAICSRRADSTFAQHARTDIPLLLAALDEARAERVAFADALGFGDDRTELAATLAQMVDPIRQAFSDAHEHHECPVVCELCGETLARETCEHCHGSGCLPNAALAYLECDWCAGVGRIHPGCAEKSYAALTSERDSLLAVVASVRELADEWASWAEFRSTPRINAFRDASDQIRAALSPTTTETGDES